MTTRISYPAFLLCLVILSGCSIFKSTHADKTSASIDAVEDDINKISVQIDATETSLDNLTKADEAETEQALELYRRGVKEVKKMQEDFDHESNKMREHGNSYFTEWQKEGEAYESSELREVSDQRQEELSKTFEQITENSGEVNRMLQSYLTEVQEIETYLTTDPTPKGVAAIAPLRLQVQENGKSVKQAIARMKAAIANAKVQMGTNA